MVVADVFRATVSLLKEYSVVGKRGTVISHSGDFPINVIMDHDGEVWSFRREELRYE